jgi:large subunit ribosomal protein L17
MRHNIAGRQLSRNSSHRLALMKNLVTSLLRHGRITTTIAKAKELRKHADYFITLAKEQTLASRRTAYTWIRDRELLSRLFTEYAQRFASRPGGYTRITRLGPRLGDAAEMALIEYLPPEGGHVTAPSKSEQKRAQRAEKKAGKAGKEKVAKKAAPKSEAKSAKETKKAAKKTAPAAKAGKTSKAKDKK